MLLLHLVILAMLCAADAGNHSLLLISCDGFRYDYIDWYPDETEFLRSLIPKGVHVSHMLPAFATKTFPNHWTIATGLYQESHGILSNNMYDPVFNATFNKGTREERWWNASLPIWITAKKHGLKSATYFWPGSEVELGGLRQDFWFEYNETVPFEQRVKTVLEWITERGVQMTTMYFHEPDKAGHRYGPKSKEVRQAIKKVDDTIRFLFDGLKVKSFLDKVNILIVSDHGVMGKDDEKVIRLHSDMDELVDRVLDSGPLLTMNAKKGKKKELLEYLVKQQEIHNHTFRTYDTNSMPDQFHYAKNRRTPEVIVLPNQGYLVLTSRDTKPLAMGHHGFNNHYSDMRVPMFAVGPSFKKNVLIKGDVEGIRQVDIYQLMCFLLKIWPQPNNGTSAFMNLMLTNNALSLKDLSSWFRHFGLMFLYQVLRKLNIY